MLRPIFEFFRKRTRRKVFTNTYLVNVLVKHPRLTNSLVQVPVTIDAASKRHARRQLRAELKISIGRAVIAPRK